ncbi:MAG: PDZ domain-containing protein, partial [Patescibacteria group bacterium]
KAGFKEFDVVLTCNDKKISEEVTLDDILAEHTIGDTITMKLLRNGKEISSKLTLEEFKKPAPKMDTQEL